MDRRRLYYVYVIEVLDRRGRRSLYVGQSAKRPEERFQEQAGCKKYCHRCTCRHYVRGKAMRLRRDLFANINPLYSRIDAERAERKLAQRLRREGYTIQGGH